MWVEYAENVVKNNSLTSKMEKQMENLNFFGNWASILSFVFGIIGFILGYSAKSYNVFGSKKTIIKKINKVISFFNIGGIKQENK